MTDNEQVLNKLDSIETKLHGRIDELEDKLLDPDKGLFTRVKENTAFRKTVIKWLTIVTVTVLGLISAMIHENIAKNSNRGGEDDGWNRISREESRQGKQPAEQQ